MNKKYEFIEPTNEIIEYFNTLWTKESEENIAVQLYKNGEVIPFKNTYRTNKEKDINISTALDNSIVDFFILINTTYHTRIANIKELSKKLAVRYKSKEDFKDIDSFINDCKECGGRYEYSFATKVFSFVDGENYPILDSYVSTLLMTYIKLKDCNVKKGSWGDYNTYKQAYELFRQKYGINKSFKEIDVFLWTYANLLQRYWKEQLGVLSFESVQYKIK